MTTRPGIIASILFFGTTMSIVAGSPPQQVARNDVKVVQFLPTAPGVTLSPMYIDETGTMAPRAPLYKYGSHHYKLRLVAWRNGKPIRVIAKMRELEGLFDIHSQSEAIQIARLYTPFGFENAFDGRISFSEVQCYARVDEKFVFGSQRSLHWIRGRFGAGGENSPDGWWGLVRNPKACKEIAQLSKVNVKDNWFTVSRVMVQWGPKYPQTILRPEPISSKGKDRLVGDKHLRSGVLANMTWYAPAGQL
jgi:hypothetical protein